MCVKWYIMVLSCISLVTRNAKHLFVCNCAIVHSFLFEGAGGEVVGRERILSRLHGVLCEAQFHNPEIMT